MNFSNSHEEEEYVVKRVQRAGGLVRARRAKPPKVTLELSVPNAMRSSAERSPSVIGVSSAYPQGYEIRWYRVHRPDISGRWLFCLLDGFKDKENGGFFMAQSYHELPKTYNPADFEDVEKAGSAKAKEMTLTIEGSPE